MSCVLHGCLLEPVQSILYRLGSLKCSVTCAQVDELDQSNNELEDTNTRLEARAEQAESQVSKLQQELQEASEQVCCPVLCCAMHTVFASDV